MRRLLACMLLLGALPGGAHELNLARFELGHDGSAEGPGTHYRLLVLLPDARALAGPERLVWPDGCEVSSRQEMFQGGRTRLEFAFTCSDGLAPDAVLVTTWGQDGAVFTSHLAVGEEPFTRVLAGRRSGVELPLGQAEPRPRALSDVAADYTGLGMFHILEGWDHLAFVLCLCLLVTGRALILLVTAFTVGHSASLALAYLGYLTVPMAPVEAVIALSVAFMAREAVLMPAHPQASHGVGLRYPAIVTGFGLLHGLGFASELEGLGVSPGERIIGLVSFNVGVEIGQLLFVALVLFLQSGARLLAWERPARQAALAGAGVLGMYWFTERIAGLLAG